MTRRSESKGSFLETLATWQIHGEWMNGYMDGCMDMNVVYHFEISLVELGLTSGVLQNMMCGEIDGVS